MPTVLDCNIVVNEFELQLPPIIVGWLDFYGSLNPVYIYTRIVK